MDVTLCIALSPARESAPRTQLKEAALGLALGNAIHRLPQGKATGRIKVVATGPAQGSSHGPGVG